MNATGLAMNFIGAVLLGACSQWGTDAEWGGGFVYKGRWWKFAGIAGWPLLAVGFLLQFIAALR